jgi:hypothetical protein
VRGFRRLSIHPQIDAGLQRSWANIGDAFAMQSSWNAQLSSLLTNLPESSPRSAPSRKIKNARRGYRRDTSPVFGRRAATPPITDSNTNRRCGSFGPISDISPRVRNRPVSRSCRTRAQAEHRAATANSSPCPAWSAPSLFPVPPAPWDRTTPSPSHQRFS